MDKGAPVEKRCWGLRPRNLWRCRRVGDWRFFCDEHRRQPIKWALSLVAILGALASIYSAWFATEPSEVRTTKQTASAALFPEGWSSLDHFDLNRSSALPVQVGHCPGSACFRFTLGKVVDREGEFGQIVYLGGGGFVERFAGGVVTRGLIKLAGAPGYLLPDGRWKTEILLAKGLRLRWIGEEHDVLVGIEDDRANNLRLGIAMYPGTYCTLVPGKDLPPGTPVPKCK